MKNSLEKIFNNLFSLLRYEISGQDFSREEILSFGEQDLQLLYSLSKGYDLAHLVGKALDGFEIINNYPSVKALFQKERDLAIIRYEQKAYEYKAICKAFENAQIPFIALKGAVIQDLYPEKWMRTSCDIDVLVKEENFKFAVKTLEKELGYKLDKISKHDAQMVAPSGVHLELHYSLLDGEIKKKLYGLFEKVWEHDKDSENYERRMSSEYFYGYFMLHTARHVKEGGCGVRPFLDVWLMKKAGLINDECYDFLKKIGLYTFAKAVESLANVWFSNETPTKLDKEFATYVLSGGVYGTVQNRVHVQTKRKKGKFRFIMSRIFLPYEQLKFQFPAVQKHKILVPFYQVKRWFNLLSKDKRKKAKIELGTTLNQQSESGEQIVKLLKDLEIY